MIYRFIFLFFFSGLPLLAHAQSNLVLKEASFVFEYKDVSGTIGDFRSSSSVNLENIGSSFLEGSVGVSSLKTGNFLRDWAIKGRKYFNEDDFPRIQFKSTDITITVEGITVEGLLTMKGITKPLTFLFMKTEKGLSGKAELYTSDYDISIKKKREDNRVMIALDFEIE